MGPMRRLAIAAAILVFALTLHAQPAGRRRAFLVGINDYTASHLGRPRPVADRGWPNLSGAANDVAAMRDMLVLLYGFDARDVVTLTDQAATRTAILQTLERHLVNGAAQGDVAFFYFAGHGSQVRNSKSDEPDKLDESIVPADSRIGARDIRDKELRPLFNRILDRGARLTIMLDNCHSGSGARGLPSGARPRGIRPDLRDVTDATDYGPRPDRRGALAISAAQDFDEAWETRGRDGAMHGAFTWAWMRALRDADAGEPAIDTFLRAQARLRNEKPFQEPALEGRDESKLVPFLGIRRDRQGDRTIVAVEKVRPDGTIVVQGGWANGLTIGTQLRIASDDARLTTRVVITNVRSLGQSEARLDGTRALPQALHSGALLEVVGWAAPPSGPLQVWTPRIAGDVASLASLARKFSAAAVKRGVRWVGDPTDVTPTHVLRRGNREWELLAGGAAVEPIGTDADAIAAISRLPAGAQLFVQLPAPAAMLDGIGAGTGGEREGIETAERAEDADYILAGRWSARRLEYAWVRPAMRRDDRRKSGLPVRTKWIAEDERDGTLRDSVSALRDAVLRLRKIHAWQTLESPPESRSAYRLALMRERTREIVSDGAVVGEDHYRIVLRAASPALSPRVQQRYVYVFVIDSDGRSTLLFPLDGSVENRFPIALPPPPSIPIGDAFEIAPPYGVDTYFLMTSDEPLPDPSILEWDAVRAGFEPRTPLERLLVLTSSGARAHAISVSATWSLEKVVFESVSPRGR